MLKAAGCITEGQLHEHVVDLEIHTEIPRDENEDRKKLQRTEVKCGMRSLTEATT